MRIAAVGGTVVLLRGRDFTDGNQMGIYKGAILSLFLLWHLVDRRFLLVGAIRRTEMNLSNAEVVRFAPCSGGKQDQRPTS